MKWRTGNVCVCVCVDLHIHNVCSKQGARPFFTLAPTLAPLIGFYTHTTHSVCCGQTGGAITTRKHAAATSSAFLFETERHMHSRKHDCTQVPSGIKKTFSGVKQVITVVCSPAAVCRPRFIDQISNETRNRHWKFDEFQHWRRVRSHSPSSPLGPIVVPSMTGCMFCLVHRGI